MKPLHIEKHAAAPGLTAAQQDGVLSLDLVKVDQAGLLHIALFPDRIKHVAQADDAERFAYGSEVSERGNKEEALQLAIVDGVAEFGQAGLGNLVAAGQGLGAVAVVRGAQQGMVGDDDHRHIGGRQKRPPEPGQVVRQRSGRGLGRRNCPVGPGARH